MRKKQNKQTNALKFATEMLRVNRIISMLSGSSFQVLNHDQIDHHAQFYGLHHRYERCVIKLITMQNSMEFITVMNGA